MATLLKFSYKWAHKRKAKTNAATTIAAPAIVMIIVIGSCRKRKQEQQAGKQKQKRRIHNIQIAATLQETNSNESTYIHMYIIQNNENNPIKISKNKFKQ